MTGNCKEFAIPYLAKVGVGGSNPPRERAWRLERPARERPVAPLLLEGPRIAVAVIVVVTPHLPPRLIAAGTRGRDLGARASLGKHDEVATLGEACRIDAGVA